MDGVTPVSCLTRPRKERYDYSEGGVPYKGQQPLEESTQWEEVGKGGAETGKGERRGWGRALC